MNNEKLKEIKIVCGGLYSCSDTEITITSPIVLEIHCNVSFSCRSMVVTINDNANIKIECFSDNSCDSLRVTSDETSMIELLMYRYSRDVVIKHSLINYVNISCGSSHDRRYIEYPKDDKILTANDLSYKARKQFISKQLPCDDITIDCTKIDSVKFTQCRYQYAMAPYFNLSKILTHNDEAKCYWVDINVLIAECDDACHQMNQLYQHNITFEVRITFDISNSEETLNLKYS